MTSVTIDWLENQPTAVYFVYDAEDNLLYVGMSLNPVGRAFAHSHKEWWKRASRIEIDWYEKRSEADEAEDYAIKNRNPQRNEKGVTRTFPTVEPIVVENDGSAVMTRLAFARALNIPEAAVIRCVEMGWLVPATKVSPGATRPTRTYSPAAADEFKRRLEAGEYAAAFPGRHKS